MIKSEADEIETELIILANRNIRFCDGEQMCQTGECIIDDDMKDILETIRESDAIIFGSPTYFDNVSAMMKNFMDRTNPMTKDMELKGKFAAIIATGEYDMTSIQKTIENFRSYLIAQGMEEVSYLAVMSKTIGTEVVLMR